MSGPPSAPWHGAKEGDEKTRSLLEPDASRQMGQTIFLTDSGFLLYPPGKGTAGSLDPHMRTEEDQHNWRSTSIHSFAGAKLSDFIGWLEALLHRLKAGPASWRGLQALIET